MTNRRSSQTRLLIADDQPDVLKALRLLLKPESFEVFEATAPREVLAQVRGASFDVLLMDLNYTRDTTSGTEGLDLLRDVQALDSTMPVVVMTAYGDVEVAVEAMRRGARDFVEKPWDNERLLAIIRTQIDLARALRAGQRLEAQNQILRAGGETKLIAESPAMLAVLRTIAKVSASDANILLYGENGTGKSVVAQEIHANSTRSGESIVTVNIGGLSDGVFESELFGHVRGAFTDAKKARLGRFELADGGTLFLDEIANVPPNLQHKLLRVLETGEFEPVGSSRTVSTDVRVLTATNADLHEEVARGRFREDLLYRLNTIEITIPPLRDRREDISLLAAHFLDAHTRRYRRPNARLSSTAMQALFDHPWPGNVRELDHAIERAVLMAPENDIGAENLALRAVSQTGLRLEDMKLEDLEVVLIKKALARGGGNVKQAAEQLGLSRSGLYRRMEKHGLHNDG